MPFNVHCMQRHADALAAATIHAQAQAHAWEQPWRDEIADERLPLEKTLIRERFRAERHRLVQAGELAFSRDDLVRQELDRLIDEQGWWNKDWEEIPPGGRVGSGRRWASENADWETRIYVRCTPAQEDLLNRVCYWTSLEPIRKLQERTGHWAMDEKQKVRAQILYPADMVRVAIHRASQGYEPPNRDEYAAWLKSREPATTGEIASL